MIYPTINIREFGENSVALIDTNFDQNPILEIFDDSEDVFETFIPLMYAFINQFNDGFDEGYTQAMDDMSEDEIE